MAMIWDVPVVRKASCTLLGMPESSPSKMPMSQASVIGMRGVAMGAILSPFGVEPKTRFVLPSFVTSSIARVHFSYWVSYDELAIC